MRLIAFYFRRSPTALAIAAVLGLFSGFAAAALLAVINHAVQAGAVTVGIGGLFVGLCVLRLASGVGAHVLMIRLSQAALRDLRLELAGRSIRARLDHLERVGRSRLAAGFGEDVLHVAQVVINVPYFLVNMVVIVGCLIYLGWMSSVVLAGFLVCVGIGLASYLGPVVWANRKLRTAREHEGELFKHFDQALEGVTELKLHAPRRREFFGQLLEPAAERVRRLNTSGITLYASAANWNRLLFFLYVGLLVWASPVIGKSDMSGMGSVQLAAYVVVLLYLMAPLEAVMNTLPHLARANVSLHKLDGLLDDLTRQADLERDLSPPLAQSTTETEPKFLAGGYSGGQEVRLENVSYVYAAAEGDQPFSLGPIDLTLRAGELVFVVGGNGAGKTTLLKLLTGLYEPSRGQITLDNHPVEGEKREAYRNCFSAVFNRFHVFTQLLGHEAETLDGRATDLLQRFGLEHKVRIEDGRLSTVDLSQGQRKRLALLVALLEDRPCYVFDEWAADQSPAFRETFYTHVLPDLARRGKVVVAATHDDRYFHVADRLVKLDEGRLVEMDSDYAGLEPLARPASNNGHPPQSSVVSLDRLSERREEKKVNP